MNNEKVTIPREVAEAIEYAVNEHSSLTNVLDDVFNCDGGGDRKMRLLAKYFEGDERGLMSALVNGYQVEKSPEEKLREYYLDLYIDASNSINVRYQYELESERKGLVNTLNILGITVEGIND